MLEVQRFAQIAEKVKRGCLALFMQGFEYTDLEITQINLERVNIFTVLGPHPVACYIPGERENCWCAPRKPLLGA